MNKERMLWFAIGAGIVALMHATASGATTNLIGRKVLIDDAGNTRPAYSIATTAQVNTATSTAAATLSEAQAVEAQATNALTVASNALARTTLYSSNYVVTSTVYIQSIGGVPYDASNQTVSVYSIAVSGTNLTIVGTMTQDPLVAPVLDWRQSMTGGAWTNITATVTEVAVPGAVTNAVAAYQFDLPMPNLTNAFFRVVDNSTGASGSGLYWLVFGGIYVDGQAGWTGAITNVSGAVTNTYQVRGGIIVNPEPL